MHGLVERDGEVSKMWEVWYGVNCGNAAYARHKEVLYITFRIFIPAVMQA